MPVHDTIQQYGDDALKDLKRIIASGGKNKGSFYLVQGKKPGESGISINLLKRDPKGAKVKTAGKVLRKASTGNRFCIGTIALENKKLVFRIKDGALAPGVVKKTLKLDFMVPELKKLGMLLKKAVVYKGDEIPAVQEAEGETIDQTEMQDIQKELTEDATTDEDRQILEEIQSTSAGEAEKVDFMDDMFEDLLAIDPEEEGDDLLESQESLIEVYNALYSDGFYNRDQLLALSEKLAKRNVDLSAFENKASVGQQLPEPMRTQVLLAKKMMSTEDEIHQFSSNFPANLVALNQDVLNHMTAQNELIAAALAQKGTEDKSFEQIKVWIQQDSLFKAHRAPLAKAIAAMQKQKVKNTAKVVVQIEALQTHIQSSLKIQGCDNYIEGASIRGTLLPLLNNMRKICDIFTQQST